MSRFKFRLPFGLVECAAVALSESRFLSFARTGFLLDSRKSDFGLPPDTDNDFHVKEIQDMVSVVQRMIKDGKPINIGITAVVVSADAARNARER